MIEPNENERNIEILQENYRLLFDESPNAIFLVNFKGIVVSSNHTSEKIYGYKKEEYIGKHFMELSLLPSNDLLEFEKIFENLLHGEVFGPTEFQIHKKNGELIWISVLATLIRIGNTHLIQVYTQNINDHRNIEQRLKESEEKYRNLFENSPFSIILLDLNGIIVDCNPAFEALLGYKKQELIGHKTTNLSFIRPEYISIVNERLKRIRNGETLPSVELELCKKDGTFLWALVQSTFVDINQTSYIQVIGYDITEQKQAEEKKRIAEQLAEKEYKKLKELDEIRKDFLDRATHELKTPLTSIYAASQLLYEEYKEGLGKNEFELVEIVKNGSEKLKNLVLNLLDHSRLESGKYKLRKQKQDLVKLFKECVYNVSYLIKQKFQILSINMPSELSLHFDKSGLEQVITNLLSNAIKYTPPSGEIHVNLSKDLDDQSIEFSVKDTGIGLTKTELENIFKKFKTFERSKEFQSKNSIEGTGLGLYISKKIVESHGGRIWAESEGRNKGAKFVVKLPTN